MKIQTCCFTGHRPMRLPFGFEEKHPVCLALKEILRKEIIKKVEQGCIRFISGVALGTDMICSEIVLDLKEQYPNIKLICAIPHEEQAAKWNEEHRTRYFDIIERSDSMVLISHQYTPTCYIERNRYMVDNSMHLVAVYDGKEKGGSAFTISYARAKGLFITVINPFDVSITHEESLRPKLRAITYIK